MMKMRFLILFLGACAVFALAANPALSDIQKKQDFIAGNGTDGPYPLSWNHILFGSEVVTLDGKTLQWGADYTLDADSGAVIFTHPLSATDGASIQYDYDTTQAQAQGNGVTVPLALALNSHTSFTGQYSGSPGQSAEPGVVDLGLSSHWSHKGSDLQSQFAYNPAMTGQEAQQTPNGLQRLGMSVAGQTAVGNKAQLTAGFSRAGTGAGSAQSDQWQAGQQKAMLGGSFSPSKLLQATVGYVQTESTEASAASAQSQISAGLSLTPGKQSNLAAEYTTTSASQASQDTQSLSVKASDSLGTKFSLSAAADESATGANGVTQTWSANAALKPSSVSELDATYSDDNNPGQTNDSQSLALKGALSAGKALSLTANVSQAQQGTQTTNSQAIQVALVPHFPVQITTGVALCQAPTANTVTTDVNAQAQPWHFLQVAGGYQWRNATSPLEADADALDSSNAKVTFAPLSAVSVVGTYDQNPLDSSGNPQLLADHGVSLQTHLGALSVTGGYVWTRQYAACATATSLQVGLGLRFSSNTQLTGDYQQCLAQGSSPGGTDTYTIGLTHDLGQAFNLSFNGSLQQPVANSAAGAGNMTASANLGMHF